MAQKSNYMDMERTAQRYSSFFGIGLGIFLLGTIISSSNVMGKVSIYICAFGAAYLMVYSTVIFIMTNKNISFSFLKYFGILSLFVVLTIAKFSFTYGRIGYADVIKETMTYDLYFIIIILSAIYNDRKLTILSGFFAASLYCALILIGRFYFDMEFSTDPEANLSKTQIRINIEIIKCVLLILASFSVNVIVSNMNKLIEQVRQSELEANEQSAFKTKVIREISEKTGIFTSLSRDQSELEKQFNDISHTQMAFANELSGHITELYDLAGDVTAKTSSQAEMSADIHSHVNRLKELHDKASERAGTVQELATEIDRLSIDSADDLKFTVEKAQILSNGTRAIQEFLTIINDITDRINLLSLNAAIEAARAGEHGKGFAVVADEISKLADATNQQSVEISKHLQQNVTDVKSVEEFVEKTSRSFMHITDSIHKTREHFNDIFTIIQNINAASRLLDEKSRQLSQTSGEIDTAASMQTDITGKIKNRIEDLAGNARIIQDGSNRLTKISGDIVGIAEELRKSLA